VPWVPLRPPVLNHLSEEAASAVLAKHFGDIVKAARELGVDRKDLRKLTWHNPNILNAADERMELFRIGVKSKIIQAVLSKSAKKQRWGVDALCESYEFRDQLLASHLLLAPAPRERALAVVDAGSVLEQEAAAELERERAAETDREHRREQEGVEVVAGVEPSRKFGRAAEVQPSLWPAGIRRPTRGRR
jgi:hypothetical protein